MLQPERRERHQVLDPRPPHLAPARADDLGIGRIGAVGQKDRAPLQVLVEQAAAHVVGVVGVAVVGRAERDDRLQRRRLQGRDLERVEAAPGDAHHADGARAPVLLGDPGDDLERVVLLLLGVLVEQDAVGIAGAPQIDPDRGIAGLGEIAMDRLVPRPHEVPLAVRDVLQDRRHRRRLGILGQPDPGRDPAAVRHRDPDVLDLDDLAERGLVHACACFQPIFGVKSPYTPSAAVPKPGATAPPHRSSRPGDRSSTRQSLPNTIMTGRLSSTRAPGRTQSNAPATSAGASPHAA